MINKKNMIFLDAETSNFGDPVFDVVFFTNHLLIKSIYLPQKKNNFLLAYKNFFNCLLKESKSNIFKRGSVIPITEILSISKQDSNPSEIIFCPPTPKNLAFGYLPFKECISFLPNSSPDFSPATTAILGFSNSFFLELDDINEQYHGKISL